MLSLTTVIYILIGLFFVLAAIGLGIWLVIRWLDRIKLEAINSKQCVVYVENGEDVKAYAGKLVDNKPQLRDLTKYESAEAELGKVKDGGYIYEYGYRGQMLYCVVPQGYKWSWIKGRRRIRLAQPGALVAAPICDKDTEFQASAYAVTAILKSHIANDLIASVTAPALKMGQVIIIALVILALIGGGYLLYKNVNKPPAGAIQPVPSAPARPQNDGVIIIQ